MNAPLEVVAPVTPKTLGSLSDALQLTDVSAIDLSKLQPDELATLAFYLDEQLRKAQDVFDAVCGPVRAMNGTARALVRGAIAEAGGKALPHDTFDVLLEHTERPDKRIDVLRTLEGVLPDDLYRQAVYVEAVDVSQCDPKLVEQVVAAGGKPKWTANLTKLNKFARDFGGAIARIVAEGSPRVSVGEPRLVIRPRESAIKAVR